MCHTIMKNACLLPSEKIGVSVMMDWLFAIMLHKASKARDSSKQIQVEAGLHNIYKITRDCECTEK